MRRGLILLFVATFLAVACGQNNEPPKSTGPSSPPKVIGQEVFEQKCAACHGISGKGDGPAASALTHKPADLTSAKVQASKDAKLKNTIFEGTEKGMPPWKNALSEKEIDGLVKYIKEHLGKK